MIVEETVGPENSLLDKDGGIPVLFLVLVFKCFQGQAEPTDRFENINPDTLKGRPGLFRIDALLAAMTGAFGAKGAIAQ